MTREIKAEFKKLLTIRSTYILSILVIVLVVVVGFWPEGWDLTPSELNNPFHLTTEILGPLALTVIAAVVASLSMTHEYRYNTIDYSLTRTNRRGKILVAKFIVLSVYALILTALIATLTPLSSYLGIVAHGHTLVPQTFHWSELIWTSLFYGWGYAMAGFALAMLIRNQIAAILAIFLIPSLVEQFVGMLILKHNAVYLPFTALNRVLQSQMPGVPDLPTSSTMSAGSAALIYLGYLVVALVIGWILFHRRDAN